MRALTLLAMLSLAAAPLQAARRTPPTGAPNKTIAITVFGNDPCPKGEPDEVVVCAREPESERYRLPKRFRGKPPTAAQGSWTNTARVLDSVSREQLPNSCSPNGSFGQTGCFDKFIRENSGPREQATTPQ